MIRYLLKDSAIYGVGQLIFMGIPIVIVPIYSRLLSPPEYGVLELITAASVLVNFIVTLEISQGMGRHYIDAASADVRREYSSTAFFFAICAYGLFLAAGATFSSSLTVALLGNVEWEATLLLGMAAACATGIFTYLQNQLRWDRAPLPFVAAATLHAIISTAVSLSLLSAPRLGPSAVLWGQIAGAAAGGAVSGWYARRCYRWTFKFNRLREMLQFSTPLVLSSVSLFLLQFIDRFVIKELMDLAAVGIYSVAARLSLGANLLLLGLSASLTPLIYDRYREQDTPAALARIFSGFLAVTIPIIIAGSLFAKELLNVVVGNEYIGAWVIVAPLAAASVVSRMYIFAPGIDIHKKTRLIMVINVMSAVASVLLCVMLVPIFGLLGAALASLIGASTGFLAYMAFSQRLYPVPHGWRPVTAATLVATAAILFGNFVNYQEWQSAFAPSLLKGVALLAGTIIVLKLLSKRQADHCGHVS